MILRIAALNLALCLTVARGGSPAEFFELRVRPLLAKNCFSCHTQSRLGGLRLDSREHLLQGGNSGPALVPGKPEASLLIQAVSRTHERIQMPPQGKLTDQEIADLAAWVKAGAIWPESGVAEPRSFWAFQPVRKPPLPKINDASWPKSPVDRFILSRLEDAGLKPVKPAGKRVLIRRASFDLIGLPPTPEEVDAFLRDTSPDAFAKVVDRLLASPHYGERWGRYWLDLARYADGQLGASKDTPFPNAFRYRDWVIQAFNDDMPYDLFVKAQIAADLLPDVNRETLLPGLGFQALGNGAADQVDVTTRVFLGLTVACAQCHDHKYDPIPTKDYYSLLGIFRSSQSHEVPLAPGSAVESYKTLQKKIEDQKYEIDEFVRKRNTELSEMLAAKTARYMLAAWQSMHSGQPDMEKLDSEVFERWVRYLKDPQKEHPFLKSWFDLLARNGSIEEAKKTAGEFQSFVLSMFAEKKGMDDRNYVAMGGAKGVRDEKTRQYTNLESLEIEKYYLWRDLASDPYKKDFLDFKGGVFYFGAKQIDRFLSREWKEYLDAMRSEYAALKKALPPQYPFLHAIRDSDKPKNVQVAIRGDAQNLGEEAPRRFLHALCDGEPPPFTKGSGRLELAEAIANAENPLTARVMVNRIWQLHFGEGIVRSPSNFGQLGESPTHPELLDYLARRFVENKWSVKSLHREIMLSATYALSADHADENFAKDPDNRLLWRVNLRQRLDAEALRDAMLAVSGKLERSIGGPAAPLDDENRRRAIYGYVSRTQPDAMLTLFDFPNPNNTSEQRTVTTGPFQRLFFLNSSFVTLQAKALAERLAAESSGEAARITLAYRLLFGRSPSEAEIRLGTEYLAKSGRAWPQYMQVLLSSSEFSSVN